MIIKEIPWLTEEAISFLNVFLTNKPNIKILEFGSGGSTIWLSKKTKFLTSIEHNKDWYDLIKNFISTNIECNPVDYRLLEKPYYHVCNEFPDEYFDFILVDGHNRVLCIKNSIRILKKNGIIMLDNAERRSYKEVYSLLNNWEFHKTIQINPGIHNSYPNKSTNWWIKPI